MYGAPRLRRNLTKNNKQMYPCRKAVVAAEMFFVMKDGVMATSQKVNF